MMFEDIQMEYGVATQCGKCEDCARSMWSECCSGSSVAHVHYEEPASKIAA
ncbi:(2Fe-2S)-binding protein [Orrella marina]